MNILHSNSFLKRTNESKVLLMKKLKHVLFAGFSALSFTVFCQQTTLQVSGRNLTTPTGQNIILRGVNYPLINQGDISLDNAADYQAYLDQVALTGANSVRIPWYTDGQNWRDIPGPPTNGTPGTVNGYVQNGHLENIITYCIAKKMIPVLSIHDDSYVTCKDNWAYFNSTVMDFWTDQAVLDLIEANKSNLIINLANEFDMVRWGAQPLATELNTFKTNYNAAIATLRQAGVTVPIMIDAPDCGQSSTELLSIAEEMNLTDPLHNLIFSAHAYWFGYANTQSQIEVKLDEAVNTNVCFVFGEVATNQDGSNPGECGLNDLSQIYPIILEESCPRNIGWLAWNFNFDCSPAREMSPTSSASDLTVFGNDIVNNAIYGLKSVNGCGAVVGVAEIEQKEFRIYPNPANDKIFVISETHDFTLTISNASGMLFSQKVNAENAEINLKGFAPGLYFVEIQHADSKQVTKLIVY